MADVKWIKIVTGIFENRKIKQIESMPEADAVLVIWFKILCLAGNINECGLITVTKDIPYTEEMLAAEFRRPLPIVRMALQIFEKFGMIEIVDNILCVSNWEKYQNIDGLERMREISRKSSAKHREKQKLLISDVTVTSRDATDIDIEVDIDKEIDNKSTGDKSPAPRYEYDFYISTYNLTCIKLPSCKLLTDKRKKAIRDFERQLTKEQFQDACTKANASAFCTGKNDRGWKADFDFLIKPDKATNVLEGKYGNSDAGFTPSLDTDSIEDEALHYTPTL